MLGNELIEMGSAGVVHTVGLPWASQLYTLAAGILSFDQVPKQKRYVAAGSYRWLYVLQGQGLAIDEESGEEFELKPGALFHRYPGRLHSVIRDPRAPWLEFFMTIPRPVFDLWSDMGVLDPGVLWCVPEAEGSVRHLICELLRTMQSVPTPSAVHAAFFNLFGAAGRAAFRTAPAGTGRRDPGRNLLVRIQTALEEEPELPLRQIAESLGISSDYLCRLVRKECKVTPMQYRIRRRLAKARVLLRETTLSIDSIAEKLGYADRFTFSRQFSRYESVAPAEFRRQRKSDPDGGRKY